MGVVGVACGVLPVVAAVVLPADRRLVVVLLAVRVDTLLLETLQDT